MIDRFDREQFEAALPTATKDGSGVKAGKTLWKPLGLLQGEYCYIVIVSTNVGIMVRSTVRYDGVAADLAQDSIRCWLVNRSNQPLAPKGVNPTRWVTRVPGWDKRLQETLRVLWALGRELGPCPVCGTRQRVLIRVKGGDDNGKLSVQCYCNKYYKLVEEVPCQKKEKPKKVAKLLKTPMALA
jgi:hypothetical protein